MAEAQQTASLFRVGVEERGVAPPRPTLCTMAHIVFQLVYSGKPVLFMRFDFHAFFDGKGGTFTASLLRLKPISLCLAHCMHLQRFQSGGNARNIKLTQEECIQKKKWSELLKK